MAKVGLKRFPWQAHKLINEFFPLAGEVYPLAIRVTAETGRALPCVLGTLAFTTKESVENESTEKFGIDSHSFAKVLTTRVHKNTRSDIEHGLCPTVGSQIICMLTPCDESVASSSGTEARKYTDS
jgi:hypothetical protein